jgi:hypothetical protein
MWSSLGNAWGVGVLQEAPAACHCCRCFCVRRCDASRAHAGFTPVLACRCAQETFGAMAKSEKVAYILEQVRLCLDRKDFVRAQVRAAT